MAAATLSACLGPLLPGACSDEERAALESVEHYGTDRPVPEADALGGCRATFAAEADPHEVMEHYVSALERAGWAIDRTHEGPIHDESGDAVGTVVDLEATREPLAATMTGEFFDEGADNWVVVVRRMSR